MIRVLGGCLLSFALSARIESSGQLTPSGIPRFARFA
jgi:hypothetical protein